MKINLNSQVQPGPKEYLMLPLLVLNCSFLLHSFDRFHP